MVCDACAFSPFQAENGLSLSEQGLPNKIFMRLVGHKVHDPTVPVTARLYSVSTDSRAHSAYGLAIHT